MNTTQVAEKILETQEILSQGLKVLNYFFKAILHIPENVDKWKKYCKDEVKRKHEEYQAKCLIV